MCKRECILLVIVASLLIRNSESCQSYGNQDGKCVEISRCPPLLAVILSDSKTPNDLRILQQLTFRCVHDNSELKDADHPPVCCPVGDIVSTAYIPKDFLDRNSQTATTTTTTTTSTTTERSYYNFKPITSTKRPTRTSTAYDRMVLRQKFESLIPPLDNCSNVPFEDRIIGGTDAFHGQYPWMARLGYRNVKTDSVEYYCGGVVINKRYILTAAHCTYGYDRNFQLVHIRLGEHDTKQIQDCNQSLKICSVPENFLVEKVITHPEYDTVTKHNDIALIRVNRDIGFDSYFIKPMCLPFMKEYGLPERQSLTSLDAWVAGWGRLNWTKSEGSRILQHVKMPIVTTEKCVRDFRNRIAITPEQLCAGGEKNQDSCGGDSGGPLMVDEVVRRISGFQVLKKFQYGIVSFGPVKCGIGIPGVYTRVSEYLGWILRSLEQ